MDLVRRKRETADSDSGCYRTFVFVGIGYGDTVSGDFIFRSIESRIGFSISGCVIIEMAVCFIAQIADSAVSNALVVDPGALEMATNLQ